MYRCDMVKAGRKTVFKEVHTMFIFAAILFVILTAGCIGVFTMMEQYM